MNERKEYIYIRTLLIDIYIFNNTTTFLFLLFFSFSLSSDSATWTWTWTNLNLFFLGVLRPLVSISSFSRWLVMFRERFIYLLWYRKRSYWTKIKTRNQTTIAIQRQNTKTNDQIICGRKQFTENHALIAMNPYLLINVAIIKSSALQKYRPS